MKRCIYIVGPLLLIVLVLSLCGCDIGGTANGTSGTSSQNTGIWVTGEGKVTVVPNVAVLSLGVEAQASTVAEAQSQASGAMDAVLKALKASNIADKDITTQYYNINPVIAYAPDTGEQKLTGYQVTNMVTVKVRKVDDTGNIIDAVATAGGNYIRINSISFTVEDPVPYQKDARLKALADAKAKAQEIANTEGLKLGEPTFINETTNTYPVTYNSAALSVPAPEILTSASISAGETEITIYMQVAYSIE